MSRLEAQKRLAALVPRTRAGPISSGVYVAQLETGIRAPSRAYARAMERVSGGEVTVGKVFDWHDAYGRSARDAA